jgi:hypothetical protein
MAHGRETVTERKEAAKRGTPNSATGNVPFLHFRTRFRLLRMPTSGKNNVFFRTTKKMAQKRLQSTAAVIEVGSKQELA